MAEKFIQGKVVGRTDYTDSLFSLQFEAALPPFRAGQFIRVGLQLINEAGERELVMRPYSLVNAPDARPYEIILVNVPASAGGILTPALHQLQPGDDLCVGTMATGFFSISEVPAAQVLWGLSTGTAIGPYLSFMHTDEPWLKFERIVYVHAVRYGAELIYQDQIAGLKRRYGERFTYIPMVSREAVDGALSGRIPAAIADGTLEARAGISLTAETAHCMLCGNPAMVNDTIAALQQRGLRKHRRREPGHITTEVYW